MNKNNLFYNKVIKQGNSLCIRIPLKISKELDLEPGTIVAIDLINMDQETKKLPNELIKAYKEVIEEFSIDELREFLNYYAIESTTKENIKLNPKYEKFKKIINNQEIKDRIKRNIEKTNFWKKSLIEREG